MVKSFLEPASVAVIGASRTPGKVGHDVVKNLIDAGYEGAVYPVNPKADEVLGLRCYPAVDEVQGDVELAECLTRVSQLAVRFPRIAECDLNPLMVYPEGRGVMALDARFALV